MEDLERKGFRSEAVRKEILRLKKRRKRRRIRIMLILGIIVVLCSAVILKSDFIDNKQIELTYYQLSSDQINSPVRLVIMADLHSGTFGEKNERLKTQLQELEPDLILMAGDMINDTDSQIMKQLR